MIMTNKELAEYNKNRQIYQVCAITDNLEKTMQAWVDTLKIGPWLVRSFDDTTMSNLKVGGKLVTEPYKFLIGITMVGNLEFELIQPVYGPTIYQEYLDRRGPGLHHIKEKITGVPMEQVFQEYEDIGVGVMQTGKFFTDIHAYLDTEPKVDFIYEIGNCPVIEVPEGMTRVFPYEDEDK